VVAEIAAITSIEHLDEQQPRIDAIVAERGRLAEKLTSLGGLDVIPSAANFLLCRLRAGNARDVQAQLESRGIMVRFYDNALLRNFLRITVGTPAQDDRLLTALAEILGAPAGAAR
jgi:histidinol-phosphate aminotransferase